MFLIFGCVCEGRIREHLISKLRLEKEVCYPDEGEDTDTHFLRTVCVTHDLKHKNRDVKSERESTSAMETGQDQKALFGLHATEWRKRHQGTLALPWGQLKQSCVVLRIQA